MARLTAETAAKRYPEPTPAFNAGARRVLAVGERIMRANTRDLFFHTYDHPLTLIDYSHDIFEAIRGVNPILASERMQTNTEVAIMLHDVIQLKGRGRRQNDLTVESESAQVVMRLMERQGQEAFTDQDRKDISRAILITQGTFEDGTFVQPMLSQAQSITEVILALADVNSIGLPRGHTHTLSDTLNLFLELKPKGAEVNDVLTGKRTLTVTEEREYREIITAELQAEIKFIQGRQKRLPEEIMSITFLQDYPEVQTVLLELFSTENFQRSISTVQDFINEINDHTSELTFRYMAERMGYQAAA